MTDSVPILLAVMTVATVVMAVIQTCAVVFGLRLARKVDSLVKKVDTDLAPLIERANRLGEDATRISALAAVQVERVDQMFGDVTRRVDTTLGVVQNAVMAPAREGIAVFAALRATLEALGAFTRRSSGQGRPEDEDALFIG